MFSFFGSFSKKGLNYYQITNQPITAILQTRKIFTYLAASRFTDVKRCSLFHWGRPACPVAPEDGTGARPVAPEDGTGVKLTLVIAKFTP